MSKYLVLDLTKCEGCETCAVACRHGYRPQGEDHGIQTLKERATFAVVCRRCEQAACIRACPAEALERQPDGILRRHNLRCVSCKLCAQACPFGTLYPELLGFYVTLCDSCPDPDDDQAPPCVKACLQGALSWRDVQTDEPGLSILDRQVAVITPRWDKEAV